MLLDQHDGITEWLVFDESSDNVTLHREYDAEPLIERNKALYNAEDGGWSPSKEWRRVASFPAHAREMFKEMYGADPFQKGNEALLKRILNDPDLRLFRTAPGRV